MQLAELRHQLRARFEDRFNDGELLPAQSFQEVDQRRVLVDDFCDVRLTFCCFDCIPVLMHMLQINKVRNLPGDDWAQNLEGKGVNSSDTGRRERMMGYLVE